MKVLIAEFDLFHQIGGGQTAYRRLIETSPAVEFHYLGRDESPLAVRPANARMIPCCRSWRRSFADRPRDTHPPFWAYQDFVEANNVAASVVGQEFDVVETADFRHFGSMLRPALRHHGVRFGRIVLAMHGRLSNSTSRDWSSPGGIDLTLDLREKAQFRAADTRYALSRSYLEEWRGLVDLEAHYLSPLRIVERPNPTMPPPSAEPPGLHCVGRLEKLKGPDIFLDLVWWLPRELYGAASIVGPTVLSGDSHDATSYLRQMMSHRGGDVAIRPAMTPAELAELFAGRNLVFLPSRYDTLNLVALESLFAGCPTVIGSGAGACRFLRESFPEIPFVELDIRNIYGGLPEICEVLRNYDDYRRRLVSAVRRCRPNVTGPSLEKIYRSVPRPDRDLQRQMEQWYDRLLGYYEASSRSLVVRAKWQARRLAAAVVPRAARSRLRRLRAAARVALRSLPAAARNMILKGVFRGDADTALHAMRGWKLARRYKQLLGAPEHAQADLDKKIPKAWTLAGAHRVDRARIWNEVARLERMRGNDLIAATYELRVMRALGEDRLGLLPAACASLKKHGFVYESDAARAMFGPPESRTECCTALLQQALARNRACPQGKPFERIDDRRPGRDYRVSIVVSMYRAAGRLSFFLNALQNQTLVRQSAAEVILIDSGSPDREYEVFRACAESLRLPIVYARTADRETIQSAWNRGIGLARGPYLALLGVDETVVPDAFEVLAGELDREPSLDWVQGNGLVSAVDECGTWKRDVMTYDRTGYQRTLSYLDACYLTFVGSLYRRSLHERCGWYDGTFGAAGDTEFKNRALPFMRTRSIPRTLGVFWNYPEDRTTESPRAEIEDLRAWYLHRTLGGVHYAFSGRDPQEAAELFRQCLRYRKSYLQHWSTDVEYAGHLAAYLQERAPGMLASGHGEAVGCVLAAYQSLDWLPRLSRWAPARELLRVRRLAAKVQAQQAALAPEGIEPLYAVFNDNRHEQHQHVWRSAAPS